LTGFERYGPAARVTIVDRAVQSGLLAELVQLPRWLRNSSRTNRH
jgi:hypothetical protein